MAKSNKAFFWGLFAAVAAPMTAVLTALLYFL